jgi:intracellular sulfur oxidation DsrE/DsrF family protein
MTMKILRYAPALIVAALLMFAQPALCASGPPGYYADQKVVYHNEGSFSDNPTYFKYLLGHLKNHIDAVGDGHVKISVVDLGPGVTLLQLANNDKDLAQKIDALKGRGVRFLICQNTLAGMHIDWHSLYGVQENDLVPAGVAELSRLQGMGYSYIHP